MSWIHGKEKNKKIFLELVKIILVVYIYGKKIWGENKEHLRF